MSTNTIRKIKLQNAILDIKSVQYALWKEAYELLTDAEASKQKELYWELANKVANVSVSDVRFNPKDTELAEFINKRKVDVTKKQESLKSFIDFSEKWVTNSKNVVKQNAALFTLLSIMKDKKITEEQSKVLIERLSTLSMDEYKDQDQYKTVQDILVDMSIEDNSKGEYHK